MTDREAQLLALGANFGVYATLAVHFVGQAIDDRRDRRAAEGALTRQAKRQATSDWRDALTAREG